MKSSAKFVASAAVLLYAATAFGQTRNGTDLTKEIQDFCNQYDNTWNTKGAVTVANTFFTDDVVFMPPNGVVIKGKETVAKVWADVYKEPTVHKCTVQGAHAEGEGAWAYGEVTITGNPAGHVRWAGFEVKQNGQWKVQLLHVTVIQEKE
jgi:ketosteroid isomerase-like protein